MHATDFFCFGHVIYQIWLGVEVDKEMLNRTHLTKNDNCGVKGTYTLFQNGRHLNILLFLFKLAIDASFLSLKFKRIFYLERGNRGQFVCA